MIRNPIRRTNIPHTIANIPNPVGRFMDLIFLADVHKLAYSDGANWRYSADDSVVPTESGEFDLTTVSGLVGWFKADSLTEFSNLDLVDLWPDMSSNGNDAAQVDTDLQPVFRTNQYNSKPCVRFAATGGQLVAPLLTTSLDFTMFLVCTLSTETAGGAAVYNGKTTSGTNNGYGIDVGAAYGRAFLSGAAFGDEYEPEGPSGLHLFTLCRSSGTTTLYHNGVEVNTLPNTPVTPTVHFTLGATDTTYQFTGDLCEAALYSDDISPTNMAIISDSLMTKWGIS